MIFCGPGMNLVDAVYVINLERSKDRMAEMTRQCHTHGLPCQRVEAVDGAKLSAMDLRDKATSFYRTLCTASMIGCALSHIDIWRRVLREGHERVLVLEDDADLVPDFADGLRRALVDVPKDFDVLVLGCFFLCDKERRYSWNNEIQRLFAPHALRNDIRTWGNVFVPEAFAGTHCYVVSRAGCAKLLRLIPKANYHIDKEMNHPSLTVYAVSPDLAFQRDMSASTIASYQFPKTLTPLLERARDSKRISLAYYLDVPMAQVGGVRINTWAVLFLLMGLAHARTLPYVTGLLLAEAAVGGHVLVPALAYALGWLAASKILR